MKYFVYYNLHKLTWSLKNWKSKRVDKHQDFVVLRDCTFKVSESGRQRVLNEKRKNVHAGILGNEDKSLRAIDFDDMIEVTYNPYRYKTFVTKQTKVPVNNASLVIMYNRRVFAKDIA